MCVRARARVGVCGYLCLSVSGSVCVRACVCRCTCTRSRVCLYMCVFGFVVAVYFVSFS